MATLQALYRWLEKQPLHDEKSLTRLAHRGWFLGPRVPVAAIPELGNAAESMPDEVDRALGQHVRRHIDEIEATLIEFYPLRSQPLQEAFGAHREGRYALSIPTFLAQADGMFYERFGSSLFRKGRRDAVCAFSSKVKGRFFQAVLHPFTVPTPLWEDTRRLDDAFEGLNRHQVLHGLKADYSTELSSLKAISLLDNLVWVLNRRADGWWTPTRPPP